MFAARLHLAKQLLPIYFTSTTRTREFPPSLSQFGRNRANPAIPKVTLTPLSLRATATDLPTSTDRQFTNRISFSYSMKAKCYGDAGLWLGFVKTQNGSRWGPRICIFTSYGSPSGGPYDFANGSPLSFLEIGQRVSITAPPAEVSPGIGLFYSRDEFNDVVQRLSADPRRPLRLHIDAKDYVFELTSGHSGAVDGVIGMLEQVLQSSF